VLGIQHSGRIGIPVGLLAAVLMLASCATVQAQDDREAAENRGHDAELDSEHLFGFTEGSDIGVPGERELLSETTGRFGKRAGTYQALDSELQLKLPLTESFRIAPGLAFSSHRISGVPDLPSRTSGTLDSAFLDTRYRLLNRRSAPFGLTLRVVPFVSRVDELTGQGVSGYGTRIGLLADREIVPGKLIGAINVDYGFATARQLASGAVERGSGLEVSGALAYQVQPGFFLGGEVRYARAYEGLRLGRLSGEAVYLGPTIYYAFSNRAWASLAWSYQVSGHAVGEVGPRDLANFERHQFRLRIGYSF
jgi:hypothetical protein